MACHTSILMHIICSFFFFNDTATTEIYTLSLHDALPIYPITGRGLKQLLPEVAKSYREQRSFVVQQAARVRELVLTGNRSEEHTSELQSQSNLVCRLLLEKKKEHSTFHAWHTESTAASDA